MNYFLEVVSKTLFVQITYNRQVTSVSPPFKATQKSKKKFEMLQLQNYLCNVFSLNFQTVSASIVFQFSGNITQITRINFLAYLIPLCDLYVILTFLFVLFFFFLSLSVFLSLSAFYLAQPWVTCKQFPV